MAHPADALLAVDTSTEQAGVGITVAGVPEAELTWRARGNHSAHVQGALAQAVRLSGFQLAECSAVVVACGPGSFSGLRVGLSTAKGIALALDVPLVGVSSLELVAWSASSAAQRIWALLPAGRSRLYAGAYRAGEHGPEATAESRLCEVDEVLEEMRPGDLMSGEGVALLEQAISHPPPGVEFQPPYERVRRPGHLAELGRRYLLAGGADQLESLEPLYLRVSAAEERRAAAGND